MIQGLYETHLFVENLERSKDFDQNTLGLEFASYDSRTACFFWIGENKKNMLGLWQKPKEEIDIRHSAFQVSEEFILNEASQFLKAKGLKPYNFLKDGTQLPTVFCRMPSLSIYFRDPDGHSLEFIALLKEDAHPEWGVLTYNDWQEKLKKLSDSETI